MFPSQDQALAEALDASLRESLAEQPRNSSGTVAQIRMYLCGVPSCAGRWSRRVTSGGAPAVT
jgi:hypothetical protein